jgi:hypothetical protein
MLRFVFAAWDHNKDTGKPEEELEISVFENTEGAALIKAGGLVQREYFELLSAEELPDFDATEPGGSEQ